MVSGAGLRSPCFLPLWRRGAKNNSEVSHIRAAAGAEKRGAEKRDRGLNRLLPEAAYLYGLVLQALVSTEKQGRGAAGTATSWLQQQQLVQQQDVLQFCNSVGHAIASLVRNSTVSLSSLTRMLDAVRCLCAALTLGWRTPHYHETKQRQLLLLKHAEEALTARMLVRLRKCVADAVPTEPQEIFAALVALKRCSIGNDGEAALPPPSNISPAVSELARQLHLPTRTLIRWADEAAAEEGLLLQRRPPSCLHTPSN